MTPLETLRELGPGDEAPEAAKHRVYGGIMLALGASAVAAGAAQTSASAAPTSAVAAPVSLLVGSKAVAASIGLVLFGGVLGAAAYRSLGPESVRIVYVDRPVPVQAPVAPAPALAPSATATATPPASIRGAPHKPNQPDPNIAEPTQGSALARERALLDLARQSAAQGDAEAALAYVERHRQQFPTGHLAEEREAMAVRALLARGEHEAARARALKFRSTYPNSLLTEVIDPATTSP